MVYISGFVTMLIFITVKGVGTKFGITAKVKKKYVRKSATIIVVYDYWSSWRTYNPFGFLSDPEHMLSDSISLWMALLAFSMQHFLTGSHSRWGMLKKNWIYADLTYIWWVIWLVQSSLQCSSCSLTEGGQDPLARVMDDAHITQWLLCDENWTPCLDGRYPENWCGRCHQSNQNIKKFIAFRTYTFGRYQRIKSVILPCSLDEKRSLVQVNVCSIKLNLKKTARSKKSKGLTDMHR